MTMNLSSPSFQHEEPIPARHTCEGQNESPPLVWSSLPPGTKGLALIVDDPDAPDPKAPKMTWVHWILYNIPPDSSGLPEGVSASRLPPGTRQGLNDWKRFGYGGPCPPIGRHRYYFKLYALDQLLPELDRATKADLQEAMEGHILERAALIGTYQKGGREKDRW